MLLYTLRLRAVRNSQAAHKADEDLADSQCWICWYSSVRMWAECDLRGGCVTYENMDAPVGITTTPALPC